MGKVEVPEKASGEGEKTGEERDRWRIAIWCDRERLALGTAEPECGDGADEGGGDGGEGAEEAFGVAGAVGRGGRCGGSAG